MMSMLLACSSSGGDDAGMEAGNDAPGDAEDASAPACDAGSAIGPEGLFEGETLTVDGVARTYVLHAPPSAVAAMTTGCGVALVIGLHGAGDTATNFLAATGLESTAAANGFVLAGPQALSGAWVLSPPQWTSPDGNPTSLQNDIALVQRIVTETAAAYRIDPARVFVCGLSRGGGFTGLLATASNNPEAIGGPYASPFAAYAISAGFDVYAGAVDFSLSSPKNPVWMLHGTADAVIPLSQGMQFADDLANGGWPVTFTPIEGAPHNWLWQTAYGYSNDDLWSFFASHRAGS